MLEHGDSSSFLNFNKHKRPLCVDSNGETAWNFDEATGLYTPVYKKSPTLLAPRFLSLGLPAVPVQPAKQ